MAKVFEDFAYKFFRLEQSKYTVTRDRIEWDTVHTSPGTRELLPEMLTDTSLRSPSRTIIIDTKYYQEALDEYFGKERFRSQNLYQMFAYLKNLERREGPDSFAEGILLYPAVSKSLDFTFTVQGHSIRLATINLNQSWSLIKQDLLNLLAEMTAVAASAAMTGAAGQTGAGAVMAAAITNATYGGMVTPFRVSSFCCSCVL